MRRESKSTDLAPLKPQQLRWRCDPTVFDFNLTSDIKECPIDIIGQPRAVSALRFGFDLKSDGYNIFVVGEVGTGRSTAVRKSLTERKNRGAAPRDLAYVHSFRDRDRPVLLTFPAGQGSLFRAAMVELVDGLRKRLPALDHDRDQHSEMIEKTKSAQKRILKKFEGRVKKRGFAVVQAQVGPLVRPVLMPVVSGNPVHLDQMELQVEAGKLAREEFERLKAAHDELGTEMAIFLKEVQKMERKLKHDLDALDRRLAEPIVGEAINDLREAFPGKAVGNYLDEVQEQVLDSLNDFRNLADPESRGMDRDEARAALYELRLPFRVNVVVDHGCTRESPVIWETAPSYRNLFGAIEGAQGPSGHWVTDHTRVKAGSLARANGGCLVIDALDLLQEQGVWPALKRALRTKQVEIMPCDPLLRFAGASLKPEPIPLHVKVVMIGTKQIYRLLRSLDEDFQKIFKVKADFALRTPLTEKELHNYACFVHKKVNDEDLLPFRREAVATIVEEGVRLAGRQGKLTTRFKEVADVIRESSWWARQDEAKQVEERHVDRALRERDRRFSLFEDEMRERLAEGSLILDIEGKKIGQVNGLVVLDVGDHVFGQPARITAVTAMGRIGIVDIERESAMSGSLHTKGVLILAGFLRQRFAQDKPLALAASLCFEQSYAFVEGDSASSAELYALLSSLAEAPIRQGIAVTGSVNQKGEVQPIGGVNEKIEGYFDLCRLKGLHGQNSALGVMIPARNLPDLMLRKDLVEAVAAGHFHIWAVGDIETGIEILTGEPSNAVFERVNSKLRALAQGVREFGLADLKI